MAPSSLPTGSLDPICLSISLSTKEIPHLSTTTSSKNEAGHQDNNQDVKESEVQRKGLSPTGREEHCVAAADWSMPTIKKEVDEIEQSVVNTHVEPNTINLDTDLADAVDQTISGLSARTRARTKLIKQNAIEAGILAPQEKPKATRSLHLRSTPGATTIPSDSESDVFEEENCLRDMSGKGVDTAAWDAWEKAQGDFLRELNSKSRPLYVDVRPFMEDLYYRADDEGDKDSPRTYVARMKHWSEFDKMIEMLMQYSKGRQRGYVKIEVPSKAFTKPDVEYPAGDFKVTTHHFRLDPLPYHAQFDNRGVYRGNLTTNPEELWDSVWRCLIQDYDKETRGNGGEEEGVTIGKGPQAELRSSSPAVPDDSTSKENSSAPSTPAKATKPAPRSSNQPKGTKPRPIRVAKPPSQRTRAQTIKPPGPEQFTEKELVKRPPKGQNVLFSPNNP
ncbi:MAG: hypothetical protein Q9218_007660, partial [Villophora microphyllina]